LVKERRKRWFETLKKKKKKKKAGKLILRGKTVRDDLQYLCHNVIE